MKTTYMKLRERLLKDGQKLEWTVSPSKIKKETPAADVETHVNIKSRQPIIMNHYHLLILTISAFCGISSHGFAVEFKKLPTEAWSNVIPVDKNLPSGWEKSLLERGQPTSYTGDALMNIGMPVGGITTGLVYLGGDGTLWNWDILNRRLKGVNPRAIQYKERSWFGRPKGTHTGWGGNYVEPVTTQPSPFKQGFALKVITNGTEQIRTLDRKGWKNVVFTGAYPFGTVSYSDPQCPIKVTLEGYSPFIPLDYDNSSYPATIMSYRVENTSDQKVDVEIGGWLENPVLIDSGRKSPDMLRINSIESVDNMVMVFSSAGYSLDKNEVVKKEAKNPDWGSMALAAIGKNPTRAHAQLRGQPEQSIFAVDALTNATSTLDKPLLGGVTQTLTLAPHSAGTAEFVIAWHFTNAPEGAETGLYYGKRFKDAAEVVTHIAANFRNLSEVTKLWNSVWYDSTLPYWFLERNIISLDCLASTTCFRFADGRFYTYEGVRSCPGHPNHVWHYAQGHSRIFPELEQDVIERVWYGFGFHPDGSMAYRGEKSGRSAIDGHCGVILSAFRAHQTNPDDQWLKRMWPQIRKSIEYANSMDRDGDGLLDTPMLTTLDEPWFGEIPWISSLYIAALKAGEQMALEMGDGEFAKDCQARAEKGRAMMDTKLFNGEWFIQVPDPKNPKKLGAYETCHIDQVMGQGWAWQVGLGRILNEDTTRSALQSLWKYNFSRNLDAYDKQSDPKGRPYFTDGEGGLVMTANALDRELPFGVYSRFACYLNETMNGFEYQAAAHMIAEGMVKEGMTIYKTINERYDGNKRNPFNEVECGDHYARSMASYGALIAICGFEYNGPKGFIGFAPKLTPENFKAPFTAAEGWGSFSQKITDGRLMANFTVKWGSLRVRSVCLSTTEKPGSVTATVGTKTTASSLSWQDGKATITLSQEINLTAGQSLEIIISK